MKLNIKNKTKEKKEKKEKKTSGFQTCWAAFYNGGWVMRDQSACQNPRQMNYIVVGGEMHYQAA